MRKPLPSAARTYRIIYLIEDERREIIVFKVGHRKEIYRAGI
ncbi:MAG: type II toxin-antitoxin system RelE family toxin [Burkholderiales bacterium]